MGGIGGVDIQIQRAIRRLQQLQVQQLVRSAQIDVNRRVQAEAHRRYVQEYGISLQRAYAKAVVESRRQAARRVKEVALRGVNEIERVTIGASPAAQRDNAEINAIMEQFAAAANEEILKEYLAAFGGRSYRTGDPSRRSGEIEAFLHKNTVARSAGMSATISLEDAVGDTRVPHIFRLNYGTEAAAGSKMGNKPGAAPPTVRISLFQGSKVYEKVTVPGREASFHYPGGAFPFVLRTVSAGSRPSAVQLYGVRSGTSGLSSHGPAFGFPASGVAPSYFVERGVAQAAKILPGAHRDLLSRWKQRVDRIRDTGGTIT